MICGNDLQCLNQGSGDQDRWLLHLALFVTEGSEIPDIFRRNIHSPPDLGAAPEPAHSPLLRPIQRAGAQARTSSPVGSPPSRLAYSHARMFSASCREFAVRRPHASRHLDIFTDSPGLVSQLAAWDHDPGISTSDCPSVTDLLEIVAAAIPSSRFSLEWGAEEDEHKAEHQGPFLFFAETIVLRPTPEKTLYGVAVGVVEPQPNFAAAISADASVFISCLLCSHAYPVALFPLALRLVHEVYPGTSGLEVKPRLPSSDVIAIHQQSTERRFTIQCTKASPPNIAGCIAWLRHSRGLCSTYRAPTTTSSPSTTLLPENRDSHGSLLFPLGQTMLLFTCLKVSPVQCMNHSNVSFPLLLTAPRHCVVATRTAL